MKNVYCPVTHSYHSADDVLSEIEPLVGFLEKNEKINETVVFPRGTVTEDGRLDLCKQSIGIEGCERISGSLKNNKTIKAILLGTDGIGNKGAKQVAGLLEFNETLETIYLGCNNIGADGAESLAKSLEANKTVKGLWLKRNPLGIYGAEKIAEMLARNTTLKILDLVNTAIEEDGLNAILDSLIKKNRSLKKLYLSGNQITGKQAGKIGELLMQNDSLETLMLSVNHLEDKGVIKIAEALKFNNSLKDLGLASNGISLEGGEILLNSLRTNTGLKHLDLGYAISTKVLGAQGNNFGDQFAALCRDYLKLNKPLQYLDLSKTGITQKGLELIGTGLRENSNLVKLRINGKLSEEIIKHLKLNESKAEVFIDSEIRSIKSVYR